MSSKPPSRPRQTSFAIDFLIVGGGIAGLAAAIALRRVGHRVVVLEREGEDEKLSAGVRVPPNMSKILFHWGLERQLRSIAVTSESIIFLRYESGEMLGRHVWDEEMLRETRGEFVFAHHADVRRLLHDTALSYGATIRRNTTVVDIDPEEHSVTLSSGQILRADVVIGADGEASIAREQLLEEEDQPTGGTPGSLMLFHTTIPKKLMLKDPDLRWFYEQEYTNVFVWYGSGRCALGYPVGGTSDFALEVYVPHDGSDLTWHKKSSIPALLASLEFSEPRIAKLARLAAPPAQLAVKDYPVLENWVHDSGRMVVIGEAAHPLPVGGIQAVAMAMEDGAVLAKIFSHLLREDQISSFLYAFQELRQERVARMLRSETFNNSFMSLETCETTEMRDNGMKMLQASGKNVMDSGEENLTEAWEEMKYTFAYDCEDEADDWWVNWGLLRERANGIGVQTDIQNLNFGVLSVEVEAEA